MDNPSAPQRPLRGKRVAIVTKTNQGAKWLFPYATAVKESGADIAVFLPPAPGDLDERLTSAGFHVVRTAALTASPLAVLRALPSFRKQLSEFEPDLVNYFLYRSAVVTRLVSLGKPWVTVHSVPGPLFYESKIVSVMERLSARLDHYLFAGSHAAASCAERIGFPTDRIRVVRFGADMAHFEPATAPQKSQARARLGLPEGEPLFVMVAYWYGPKRLALGNSDVKGHDVLLAAWKRFTSQGGRGHLLLVGGGFGEHGAAYRAASIAEYGLTSAASVTLLDTVEDVRDAYRAADVSVSPSRSDNYGAASEASAMGLPTIAAAVGGLPEIVKRDSTGWLFPSGDVSALVAELESASAAVRSGQAREFGQHARRNVEHLLDWRTITSEYVGHLVEFLAVH